MVVSLLAVPPLQNMHVGYSLGFLVLLPESPSQLLDTKSFLTRLFMTTPFLPQISQMENLEDTNEPESLSESVCLFFTVININLTPLLSFAHPYNCHTK